MGVVAADTELSAPQVPHPLLTPRPTSTTSGSSTWRASSWPTTCRPCPCWPTTPLRAGPRPGEMPLPDRPPLQPRLPLRASSLNAELCPGGRPSPEPGLDTAVPRPHTPTEDRGLSPQALRLGPSAPDHPPRPAHHHGLGLWLLLARHSPALHPGLSGAKAARCPRLAGGSEENTTGTSSAGPGAGTRLRASGGSAGGSAPTSRLSTSRTCGATSRPGSGRTQNLSRGGPGLLPGNKAGGQRLAALSEGLHPQGRVGKQGRKAGAAGPGRGPCFLVSMRPTSRFTRGS